MNRPSIHALRTACLTEDAKFAEWRSSIPDKFWESIDLSALRMGYELHRALSAQQVTYLEHDLIKTGDKDATPSICDANGEVVLGYCRRCGQGEGDLVPTCPGAREPIIPQPSPLRRDRDPLVTFSINLPNDFPLPCDVTMDLLGGHTQWRFCKGSPVSKLLSILASNARHHARTAEDDAKDFGMGFTVDGKRVEPWRVIVHTKKDAG